MPDEVISVRGLSKIYPQQANEDGSALVAVDDLELSVTRGEIFGLLGPNGAGKTTTVGMLTTRVIPTTGVAIVNGVDVVADSARAKRDIGVVPQANTLDRSLTARENLYFHGRYFGMSDGEACEASDDLLEQFRLTAKAHSEVHQLSGGMAQRLMVARAILHRPAVLFLDEPTAGLDPQSRLALWDIVGRLHDEGQTILLTTHYMEEADRMCDRVAIMDQGRILALDTPAGLKQSSSVNDGKAAVMQLWLSRSLDVLLPVDEETSDGDRRQRDAAERALSELVKAAESVGIPLPEPPDEVTLETVFINLTGRELRE
ncbi:MAG TPA: ABC transporter ATP-binding protein [Acidimicrobiales bacterium]|nr:ABC transporter ATP-binding protein [Acidimicrobiales bacterium]